MKLALCTISFRHQLISFQSLVQFAIASGLDGIELWGAHADALHGTEREETKEQLRLMHSRGMRVTMISDYLDIGSEESFGRTLLKMQRLIRLARWFGTDRIRTFAGSKASRDVEATERAQYAKRLYRLCELCAESGMKLLVETHPDTLADHTASVMQLIGEVNHPSLGVNLDFLHLWEAGDDPLRSYELLLPWVHHFHVKNVSSPERLGVFKPDQVYAAGASREGMVPLSAGALDYEPILLAIAGAEQPASLEWFGADPLRVIADDASWVRRTSGAYAWAGTQ